MDRKTKISSVLGIFMLGTVAGHHIDDLVEKYNLEIDRYPIKLEYEIIENCISAYEEPLRRSHLRNKKDICICALDKTELEYEYESFQLDQDGFLDIFEKKADKCM
ncbi:hypothetical protein [Sulfurimonas sp. HSL3-7]|uniref:hypothetical protein n=1 Tax=Sulfonitrofixus jiaomeiensis TaxID=3131938 RepID=UPI0031F9BBDE